MSNWSVTELPSLTKMLCRSYWVIDTARGRAISYERFTAR